MKRGIFFLLWGVIFLSMMPSCKRRHYIDVVDAGTDVSSNYDRRHDREEYREERSIRRGTKVSMEENNGVYLVPINVNGLDLNFIFDTGASSICISSAEAAVMVRQGQISRGDILGQQHFQDATGDISVGTIVNLKTIEIGGIVLHNVEATVVDNIAAPLLLGQTALAKFGKISIDCKF